MLYRALLVVALVLLIAPTTLAYNPPPSSIFGRLVGSPPPPCDPPPCPDPPAPPLGPDIKIQLPPRLIMTPDKLLFPDFAGRTVIYRFVEAANLANSHFIRESGAFFDKHRILTSIEKNNTDGAYYSISIIGFKRDELPNVKDFRLTFRKDVSKVALDQVVTFLETNSIPTARLTGPGCAGPGQSHICLDAITKVRGIARILPEAHLRQTVPVRGIFVEGNVAAPGQIKNFTINPQSIAVGGKIDIIDGAAKIEDYINNSTKFAWNNVSGPITDLFDRRLAGTKFDGSTYAGNWLLNSTGNLPSNGNPNSFSSPPEGKLWYVEGDLTLGATNFSGSGTIAVNGNLVINGELTCQALTRLGLIVNGSITFAAGNNGKVDCGAYAAIGKVGGGGGNINFVLPNTKNGTLKGIFVAAGNISLPNPNSLTGVYNINYDSFFAKEPTVLFKELIKLIFAVTS